MSLHVRWPIKKVVKSILEYLAEKQFPNRIYSDQLTEQILLTDTTKIVSPINPDNLLRIVLVFENRNLATNRQIDSVSQQRIT